MATIRTRVLAVLIGAFSTSVFAATQSRCTEAPLAAAASLYQLSQAQRL
jgi:hypothetical protein